MNTRLLLALVLAPLLAQAAPATAPLSAERFELAPKVGFFKPTSDLGGALFAGLELGYLTPWLDGHLVLSLEGDFYRPADSSGVSSPQLTFNGRSASGAFYLQERELAVLLDAAYRFAPISEFAIYLGAGPGLYTHQAKTTAFGTTNTEKSSSVGFQLLGGVERPLGPGSAFLEIRYQFTQVDFLSTGSANVGGVLAAALGYRFGL